ncbi:MAG: hypothetical protein ACI8UO_002843 [Verrucomicrobiales bacterium]|jgi:hypothetical protein
MRTFLPISLSLCLAVLLTSCDTGVSSSSSARHRTARYLPYEVAQGANYGATNSDSSPIPDQVSHWDGNGVQGDASIVIDLSDQRAYFYMDKHLVGVSKISSGTDGFDTPTGRFKITQLDRDHRSNLYGDYVWPSGEIAQKEVDVTKDKKPSGANFLGAPMPYFMRFHNGVGMHGGFLPGFAASHGCVRMPDEMAEIYFNNVSKNTPVTVRR